MMSKVSTIIIIAGLLFLVGKYLYQMPKYSDGEIAPDFTDYLPNGDSIKLSDFKGKMVLLDFWGSWCGPCRQENPALVALYKKYNGKKFKNFEDFEIVSVGIETRKERWLAAIQKDGLYWPNHVSEIKRLKSNTAKLYGVREIPTKYLIDPRGHIIEVNPSFELLDQILNTEMVN